MPFQAVATQRLYEQVAGQVTDLVARGEFKPGDRLPPERDLAKLLGVSRPTVREAMIALEIAGLVEVRVGAGASSPTRRANGETHARLFEGVGSSPLELIAGAARHRAGGRGARGAARDPGRDRRHRRDDRADRQGARHARRIALPIISFTSASGSPPTTASSPPSWTNAGPRCIRRCSSAWAPSPG
jgi:DNA-binding transcriptional MocR family regulator